MMSVICSWSFWDESSSLTSEYVSLMMARNMFWETNAWRNDEAAHFPFLKSNVLLNENTYQQNKENKEHIGDKVDWPKNSVGTVDCIIIKVSENNPELCEAAGGKRKEIHKFMLIQPIEFFPVELSWLTPLTCTSQRCWRNQPLSQRANIQAEHKRRRQWRTWWQIPRCL